ncbi:MAG TPA: hypothetical protein DCK93_08650 [Blastocatellia bacterium]|jgi:hypothetical protein|nr:hypothetical protein [Blastocatellia bacterium]
MATDAARVVDDLGPLHRAALRFFEHESSGLEILARANYITPTTKENTAISSVGKVYSYEIGCCH